MIAVIAVIGKPSPTLIRDYQRRPAVRFSGPSQITRSPDHQITRSGLTPASNPSKMNVSEGNLLKDSHLSMANHFSALKRARQTTKRTAQNRANASRLRTALRKFRAALQSGDSAQAKAQFSECVSQIDQGVKKGVIHKNTAARYKSRLNARLGK